MVRAPGHRPRHRTPRTARGRPVRWVPSSSTVPGRIAGSSRGVWSCLPPSLPVRRRRGRFPSGSHPSGGRPSGSPPSGSGPSGGHPSDGAAVPAGRPRRAVQRAVRPRAAAGGVLRRTGSDRRADRREGGGRARRGHRGRRGGGGRPLLGAPAPGAGVAPCGVLRRPGRSAAGAAAAAASHLVLLGGRARPLRPGGDRLVGVAAGARGRARRPAGRRAPAAVSSNSTPTPCRRRRSGRSRRSGSSTRCTWCIRRPVGPGWSPHGTSGGRTARCSPSVATATVPRSALPTRPSSSPGTWSARICRWR
ncbi:hypothetical protein SLI_7609 [Streptomyces lividans 1326]|uniref:Uncharacterized protein n=1 Tax=Streptomyces lividans 1326 TaxID=1200984 RepID=A0A7U9E1I1_STRLI|nr:hypothetical protein SLI_7609 [Streptomyces lividans 1326]